MIGASMLALEGNRPLENVLMNLAGLLAPVVAFVPTPYHENCYSIRLPADQKAANASRDLVSTIGLVVDVLVLAALGVLFVVDRPVLLGWAHAILWVEGVLITLFAIFWVLQTIELWNEGLRQPASPAEYLPQGSNR